MFMLLRKVTGLDDPIRNISLTGPASGVLGGGDGSIPLEQAAAARMATRRASLPPPLAHSLHDTNSLLADTVFDRCPSRLFIATARAGHIYSFRGEAIAFVNSEANSILTVEKADKDRAKAAADADQNLRTQQEDDNPRASTPRDDLAATPSLNQCSDRTV